MTRNGYKIGLSILFSFIVLWGGSPSVFAQPSLILQDISPPFNFTIGNWSQTYNLSASITAVGGNVPSVNLTWYMPYGLEPVNYSDANAGFVRVDKDTVSASIQLGNFSNGETKLQNLTIKANVSAFPRYDSTPLFIYANVTNGTITNETAPGRDYYGKNYWINPRLGVRDSMGADNSNSTVIFENWNQTDPVYQTMTPLYTYDASADMPILANNTYADVMYFGGKEMIERPNWMRMWGYNLTFRLYFNGSGQAVYWLYSPVNNTDYPEQTLFPLYIYTINSMDPMENVSYNMTLGTPSQAGFSIWYNGTEYNETSLATQQNISITYSPSNQADLYVLQVNASSTANNTDITILFTLMNMTNQFQPSSISPLYVDYQNISGFSFDKPPEMGKNITTTFIINVSNRLTNYTLENLKLHFFMPLNVSMETNSGTTNFTMAQSADLSWYDNSAGVWNSTVTPPITRADKNMTIQDKIPGSMSEDSNITIWFASYDIDLSSSLFNNWNPGSSPRSNASMRFTANLSFPALNESDVPSGAAGTSNEYNVSVSMSMQAGLNLTDKVPGLSASSTNVEVIVDGTALDPANYSIGSLTIDNIGSGTHSISVSYSVPSATTTPGGGGGGGGGGRISPIKGGVSSLNSSVMKNIISNLNLEYKFYYNAPKTLAAVLLTIDKYPAVGKEVVTVLVRTIQTLQGDVYELAAEKILENFRYANTLYIARGDEPVDSMAAVTYAKAKHVPIILTETDKLPEPTLNVINTLKPKKIIIVGGVAAINKEVENRLSEMAEVERVWGETRVETSVEMAKSFASYYKYFDTIVIVDGDNPSTDAAIIASGYKAPLLYVRGNEISEDVRTFLQDHKKEYFGKQMKVLTVGVSDTVASEIENLLQ